MAAGLTTFAPSSIPFVIPSIVKEAGGWPVEAWAAACAGAWAAVAKDGWVRRRSARFGLRSPVFFGGGFDGAAFLATGSLATGSGVLLAVGRVVCLVAPFAAEFFLAAVS